MRPRVVAEDTVDYEIPGKEPIFKLVEIEIGYVTITLTIIKNKNVSL